MIKTGNKSKSAITCESIGEQTTGTDEYMAVYEGPGHEGTIIMMECIS